MLVLNKADIEKSVTILDVLESIEKAFLLQESGGFMMPERMHAEIDGNVLLLMPAFREEFFATKLISVFPDNKLVGKPSIYGTVVLNDSTSGEPLALMEGSVITGLRTGAVGGLGAAFTTPKEVSSLGIIGAGYQGYYQVLFICTVRNIGEVNIFDPFKKDSKDFVRRLKELLPHINFQVHDTPKALLANSELIVTATTSKTPVVPADAELLKGKHFIGLGSFKPEIREYPDSLFDLVEKVVVDTDHAAKESGDLRIPIEKGLISSSKILRLGEIINEKKTIDIQGTTFFKSVGMALFDLLIAEVIYKKAKEKSIGAEIDFG